LTTNYYIFVKLYYSNICLLFEFFTVSSFHKIKKCSKKCTILKERIQWLISRTTKLKNVSKIRTISLFMISLFKILLNVFKNKEILNSMFLVKNRKTNWRTIWSQTVLSYTDLEILEKHHLFFGQFTNRKKYKQLLLIVSFTAHKANLLKKWFNKLEAE
jgi:hypothetical protein